MIELIRDLGSTQLSYPLPHDLSTNKILNELQKNYPKSMYKRTKRTRKRWERWVDWGFYPE